ncbi:TraB/GumN family protein [Allosphingosinicella sp.]|jgi:hypothetical protein|uniref:TraB/GumN family protein n=1 Tax=Allosphingosinicella sp. TaxID=2823234 RepID=UPI002F23E427
MLNRFTKGWTKLLAAFAGLALTACATQPAETAPAAAASGEMRPALWRLSDPDTNIYLFGTIHTLPEGVDWRTPAIEAAIAASDELVTEIVIPDDPMAAMGTMMRLGMGQGLPPILERVPAGKREALSAAIASSGLPAAIFDRMKTWTAAVTLAAIAFQRAGLDPERGVERSLAATFRQRQKPWSGLETMDEQLGFFDSLPEAEQRTFLVGVLESPEEIRREFDGMLASWTSGDIAAIARTFDDEAKMSANLRETLLVRRNSRWAEWLQRRLDRPGTVFVAVGAGHLAGRDSVQDMLQRRGLRAERVQ